MKCPCLYSEDAPICRADGEAMRIPSGDHLARFCTSGSHRRCDIFRTFVGALASGSPRPGTTSGTGESGKGA